LLPDRPNSSRGCGCSVAEPQHEATAPTRHGAHHQRQRVDWGLPVACHAGVASSATAVGGTMPFILIHGTFHLVGRTQAGNPSGFEPDGDSIQFKPTNPQLLDRLDQPGRPYRLTLIDSTQLRHYSLRASTRWSCTLTAPTNPAHWPTRPATSSPASSGSTRCPTGCPATSASSRPSPRTPRRGSSCRERWRSMAARSRSRSPVPHQTLMGRRCSWGVRCCGAASTTGHWPRGRPTRCFTTPCSPTCAGCSPRPPPPPGRQGQGCGRRTTPRPALR
jgi:hypothetical protein